MIEKAFNFSFDDSDLTTIRYNSEYNFNIKLLKAKQKGFSLVFTSGMSKTIQKVNESNKHLESIELFFCMPDYLSIDNEHWSVDWLEKIAAIPQKNSTWIGIGDTIPYGKPAASITEDFLANHFIIMNSNWMNRFLTTSADCTFLAIVPIFQEEFDYKTRNSHTVLFERFSKKLITELVDPYRVSACRKRILGLI